MFDDLKNPVATTAEAVPGLFRKAGPGPVTFKPVLALGLEVPIRGGFYRPDSSAEREDELWSYQHKVTAEEVESGKGKDLGPPLLPGSLVTFDPGDSPFGLWVGNDQFRDRVYTEPGRVTRQNPRLASQPYKVMIYALKDPETGEAIPNAYLMGWEYSTNDDFQDVVCRIDNVSLIR